MSVLAYLLTAPDVPMTLEALSQIRTGHENGCKVSIRGKTGDAWLEDNVVNEYHR